MCHVCHLSRKERQTCVMIDTPDDCHEQLPLTSALNRWKEPWTPVLSWHLSNDSFHLLGMTLLMSVTNDIPELFMKGTWYLLRKEPSTSVISWHLSQMTLLVMMWFYTITIELYTLTRAVTRDSKKKLDQKGKQNRQWFVVVCCVLQSNVKA